MSSSAQLVPAPGTRARPIWLEHWAVLEAVSRVASIALTVAVTFALAGILGLGLYAYGHAERIYEGVEIAGVNVGGMTTTQAAVVLQERFEAYAEEPITLVAGEQSFAITPRQAGMTIDADATAREAFAVGRSGSLWSRSRVWAGAFIRGEAVEPQMRFDVAQLDAELQRIAPSIVSAPVDAYVQMDAAGEPALVPDLPGVSLDVAASRNAIMQRLSSMNTEPVTLVTVSVPATVMADSLAPSLPGARAAVASSLVLTTGDQAWRVVPDDLKKVVSVSKADGAVTVNRAPLQALMEGIATEIDRPPVDAGIAVDESGALIVVPGVDSAEVDIATTVDAIVDALRSGSHDVEIAVERWAPTISDADAAAAILEAEALVEQGLRLTWSGGSANLGRGDLIAALTIEPRPGEPTPFMFDFDRDMLVEVLAPVVAEIDVPAEDARFRLVDGVVTLVSEAKRGQTLDIETSLDTIAAALLDHADEAALTVKPVEPTYTEAALSEIRVPHVLGDSWTYYGDSSDPRRQNVERSSELENGWLVPPGGIFSFNEVIGSVDEANGFVTGYGIVADGNGGVTTAPVIGGGICQVATTVFQAAFWAGLPIVERYQHPYWLNGYGQAPRGMKGLDAMVNIEDELYLDMKFRNATDDWIAVVLMADGEHVTAQILGTDPGWTVEVDGPEISNVVPKDDAMRYTESSELPTGQELVVEHAQEGFDTAITRVVTQGGELVEEYTLTSSFLPSRNTTLRGTG